MTAVALAFASAHKTQAFRWGKIAKRKQRFHSTHIIVTMDT